MFLCFFIFELTNRRTQEIKNNKIKTSASKLNLFIFLIPTTQNSTTSRLFINFIIIIIIILFLVCWFVAGDVVSVGESVSLLTIVVAGLFYLYFFLFVSLDVFWRLLLGG